MTSFLEHIQFQAKSRPKIPAIMTVRNVVTYEELLGRVRAVIQHLLENDMKPGQTLALSLQEPISHVCGIVAAMTVGVATVSTAGPKLRLAKKLSVDAILCDHAVESETELKTMQVAPGWLKDRQVEEGALPPLPPPANHVARIITTSGTTGEQKAVPFTEEQLMQRAWTQVIGLRPVLGTSKTLGMMGLASGAGFTNMMLILMTGGTLLLVPGLQQLARFSSLHQIDRIIASTAQLMGMLRRDESLDADFSGVKSMVVGGSHIPRAVARRARSICRNIICLYGSTEVGVVATAPTDVTIQHQNAVGYVVPGVEVQIVDENGKALGRDREGVIRVKVPKGPTHYLNDDEASKTVFRDGWFYPGDIGSLSDSGLLLVSGRVSERINAGGVKVAPSIIEDVIGARPEISDVAAFEHENPEGIAEIAVAVVPHETLDRAGFNRQELRQAIQKQLREKAPRRWMIVKEIPRNEQGKIDRAQLKQLAKTRLAKQGVG